MRFIPFLFWAGLSTAASPQITTIYSFAGGSDAAYPGASLTIGKGGVLYSTSHFGGTGACALGCGTVYSLAAPVGGPGVWTETVLHRFGGSPDGAEPYAGVAIGAGGALFGTTYEGGAANLGTVYSLAPPATPGGAWTESVLYSFAGSGANDGAYPDAGVVSAKGGILYGTTYYGGSGAACGLGCGVVYALTPPAAPGGAWTETVLYNFAGGAGDGANPLGLAAGANGVLYGVTRAGGASNAGTVFALAPPESGSSAWTETVLYNFGGAPNDGGAPTAVSSGAGGVLYGTTSAGGSLNMGTVYALTPPASGGAWSETVLHNFLGGNDGATPFGGVAIGTGGLFYGVTDNGGTGACFDGCGTVYSMTPGESGGSWSEVILYNFNGGAHGSNPIGGVTVAASGALYGTTGNGGSHRAGTVFKLKP